MLARRRWAELGTIVIPLGVLVVLVGLGSVGAAGLLPDPMATHWGLSGAPNGSMSLLPGLLLLPGLWIVLMGFVLRQRKSDAPDLVWFYFAGGIALAVQTSLVVTNWDVPRWQDADDLPLLLALFSVLGAGGLFALLGRFVERKVPPEDEHLSPSQPSVGLHAEEKAAWIGGARSRGLAAVATLSGIVLAAYLLPQTPRLSSGVQFFLVFAVGALVTVTLLTFASMSMTVSSHAVSLRLGPWRWPARVYRLSEIAEADAIYVEPMRFGGWGYRICGSRCRAFVIRRGEALELRMKDGSRRVFTVDGAEQGAGLVNDLIALQSGGSVKG